jgi:hypothetical protein
MPSPVLEDSVTPIRNHIQTSTEHADPQWRKAALSAIRRVARKREKFTSADVLEALERSKSQTHDLRALGGVLTKARNLGLIENAGLVRRRDKHGRGVSTIWRSLLYAGKAADQPV